MAVGVRFCSAGLSHKRLSKPLVPACPRLDEVLCLRLIDAEFGSTADLVGGLLQEQHPDMAGLAVREVAGGWGNQQWRLRDELGVRMPRSERAPDLQRKECRWLPVLAPRLPLPVPIPVRGVVPSALFPEAVDRDDVVPRAVGGRSTTTIWKPIRRFHT